LPSPVPPPLAEAMNMKKSKVFYSLDDYCVLQVAELNDRKIGKLCEYASKNPLRIPKVIMFVQVYSLFLVTCSLFVSLNKQIYDMREEI
jgi:hypothetical protein